MMGYTFSNIFPKAKKTIRNRNYIKYLIHKSEKICKVLLKDNMQF